MEALRDLVPKVGLGVMVLNVEGKVLLGRRSGSHGAGEHAFPGGLLEHMESFEDGIRRELREEAGIEVTDICFLCVFNFRAFAPKHHVGLGFTARLAAGEPQVREPDKCSGWGWYALDALPEPLFAASSTMIEAWKTGRTYFDDRTQIQNTYMRSHAGISSG
jgi:8-oxo-dGTP diphosphatase